MTASCRAERIDLHRACNVFECLLAQVLERQSEPVADMVADRAGYANPARLGNPFQSGGDIYPIAVDVPIFPDDDVTQIDADTEYNPLLLGRPRIAFGHPTLHGGRAGDSLYDAREFDENAITGRFDDAALVLSTRRIDGSAAVPLEPRQPHPGP